mmetsp:Transcript_20765/g.37810  ORF Transcript_20765/g.37810 Transcript_20765/m.37810 type:complete len:459 (-) Transcript_20765:4-1380(-)
MAPKSKVNPELDEVLARAENMFCADCGAKAPRWASVNLGILMCIDCSGAHRNLGTHISVVKSTTLDKWQPKWIETVSKIGNKTGNAFYEHNLPKSQKLQEGEAGQKVANWIRYKYDKKEWVPRGRASPSELLAKGLNPDYDGDCRPDDSRRREGRSDKSEHQQPEARKKQSEDVKHKRATVPAQKSNPSEAEKPSVDLLGEDFSNPTGGQVPAPTTWTVQAPNPSTASPWTADFQHAPSPSPFGASGGVNPAVEQPAQVHCQQPQQLPAQHMQQQACPTQMVYAEQPPVASEQMPSAKVDSLKNALGALYQQDTEAKSAQARLAAAPWPTLMQQSCAFGLFGSAAVNPPSHQQMSQFQQPQQQMLQPPFRCAPAAVAHPYQQAPLPAAPAQIMPSQIDTTTPLPTNQLSALYQQALGHLATDAGLHMMQSSRQLPVAVGPAAGASCFDIDAFSAFSCK